MALSLNVLYVLLTAVYDGKNEHTYIEVNLNLSLCIG